MEELKDVKEQGAAYIDYTARAWSTAFDGIIAHAAQVRDVKRDKRQSEINEDLYGRIGQGISGVYSYKGSKANISDVTSLTGVKQGDVWNVVNEFDLNGEHYPAGTNVAATQDSSSASSTIWDPLGGSIDLSPLEERISCLNSTVIPRVDGIVADGTIKEMGLSNATKIVYITAKKKFAAVLKTGGLTGDEYYSTWTGNSVLPSSAYTEGTEPIRTKPYLVGKDIYVFDENDNFTKIKTGGGEVIDSTTDTTSTDKALSARATHLVSASYAQGRQSTEVVGISRVVRGAKIEMSSYAGTMKVPPMSLVLVIDPASGGLMENSLCAFLDGKYYPTSGMNKESLRIKKEKTFVRTSDGSIYTQDISGNPCIFDASEYVSKTSFTQLEGEVNKLKELLKMS